MPPIKSLLLCCALLIGCGGSARRGPETPPTTEPTSSVLESPSWSVKRRGSNYVIEHPGLFKFEIPTAQADRDGWSVCEIEEQRVRFVSNGESKALTIYPDGRAYCDGEFHALSESLPDADAIADQHRSPAELSVAESLGRVNRSTPGDANNDGYNENTGTYAIIATGARLELTISPRTRVLVRPMLEVSGLGPGKALVTMEGRLVETAHRLSNGNILIELPARIERPTMVNIRLE